MQNMKLAIWVGITSLAHTQNLIVFLKYDTCMFESVCACVCVCVCEYICVCMHVCQIAYKNYIIMVTKFNNQSHTHNLYWWPPQSAIASYSTAFVLSPLPHYDCFMLARSALSQSCSQHFNSMYAGSYVMEDNRIGCGRGQVK